MLREGQLDAKGRDGIAEDDRLLVFGIDHELRATGARAFVRQTNAIHPDARLLGMRLLERRELEHGHAVDEQAGWFPG